MATSTRNPPPSDLKGRLVLKMAAEDSVSIRPEHEATEREDEVEHTFFIVACAIGVRRCMSKERTHSPRTTHAL
jgi:hypothetical protein